jgi:hypothetical protein
VRTITETAVRDEAYTVQRPVFETHERDEQYIVRRAVQETLEREVCSTQVRAVTTYRPVVVDQGCFENRTVLHPGPTSTHLQWIPGHCVMSPVTGASVWQMGGFHCVRRQCPPVAEVQRVWRPNLVTHQVAQTCYVPETVVTKVPYQVCRYVDETHVRKVPYQVCRMVEEQQVRKVPYQVCRQVVERVEHKVPYQVCKFVEEEQVRQVPVTTCRMTYEERVEQIPVQVCRKVPFEQTVRVPRVVEKRVPVTYTLQVPRCVVYRVPIDPCTGADLAPAAAVPAGAAPATDKVAPPTLPLEAPPPKTEPGDGQKSLLRQTSARLDRPMAAVKLLTQGTRNNEPPEAAKRPSEADPEAAAWRPARPRGRGTARD